jgi:hypothetical protein
MSTLNCSWKFQKRLSPNLERHPFFCNQSQLLCIGRKILTQTINAFIFQVGRTRPNRIRVTGVTANGAHDPRVIIVFIFQDRQDGQDGFLRERLIGTHGPKGIIVETGFLESFPSMRRPQRSWGVCLAPKDPVYSVYPEKKSSAIRFE